MNKNIHHLTDVGYLVRVGILTFILMSALGMFAGTAAAQAEAGVSVTDGPTPDPVTPGEPFDVTIQVKNIGDSDGSSTGVRFEDVPDGLTFKSGGTTYVEGEGPISLAALDPGQTESFDVTVSVDESISTGDYSFTAAGAVTSSFTGDTAVNFTVAGAIANVSVQEQPPSSVSSGESFTADIEVTNTGEVAGTATGLKFVNASQGTTFQVMGSNYSSEEGPVSTTALDPGESESFEVKVVTPTDIESGNYNFNVEAAVTADLFTDTTSIRYTIGENVSRFNTGGPDDDTPNRIDQAETLSAISKYNQGEVDDQRLVLKVISAYNDETNL
jgi:uncharacterized membrane protein